MSEVFHANPRSPTEAKSRWLKERDNGTHQRRGLELGLPRLLQDEAVKERDQRSRHRLGLDARSELSIALCTLDELREKRKRTVHALPVEELFRSLL